MPRDVVCQAVKILNVLYGGAMCVKGEKGEIADASDSEVYRGGDVMTITLLTRKFVERRERESNCYF